MRLTQLHNNIYMGFRSVKYKFYKEIWINNKVHTITFKKIMRKIFLDLEEL